MQVLNKLSWTLHLSLQRSMLSDSKSLKLILHSRRPLLLKTQRKVKLRYRKRKLPTSQPLSQQPLKRAKAISTMHSKQPLPKRKLSAAQLSRPLRSSSMPTRLLPSSMALPEEDARSHSQTVTGSEEASAPPKPTAAVPPLADQRMI